ncbi:MAG: chemotaxis protein CheY [Alphaproteobacteria bacterium]|nr:chemotaxis protein CheY [Alphaproteobacteria bacterium]
MPANKTSGARLLDMTQQLRREPTFLAGGGELGRLIGEFAWETTSLGPIASWPATLRSTIALILRSRVPIVTLWGDDGVMIYNDAYSIFAAARHPRLLGSKVREGWPEVADFNDNVMKVGLAGGTLEYRDQELKLYRSGHGSGAPEQVWMNLDYSPILDDDGRPVGVMAIVVETSAKVRAEQQLSGQHERLRQMFEQAPGFVVMLEGPDHVFQLANEAYFRLVGHRDIVGKKVADALPEVIAQGFVQLLDQVYRSGEAMVGKSTPLKIERRSGIEQRFVDFVYQPLRGPDGQVSGIFVQGNDVTEERRAEEELREHQNQLAAFVSQSTAGFAQVDLDGTFTLVNERFCEIAGRDRDELLTITMQSITHPDDLGRNIPLFERAVADGTPYTHEKRYIRPDGAIVWVNNSVSVIRRANGEPYGVLAVTLDVTERRRTEEAIHENEARLRALTENLPGGMVYQISTGAKDGERRFLFVSESHEKLTGIPAKAVLADATIPYSIMLPEDREAMAAAEAKATAELRPFDVQARFRHANGELRWSRIISAPRAQPDGSIIWDGIQIDITDQKNAEAALRAREEDLRKLNESLEERVRSRTSELEAVHEQLRQSQKLEAMGQLTGGVAHDFNNLLTPIVGSLDMLQRREIGGAREQRLVGAALESAEKAKTLVQRLLAFARRQPLQAGPVDLPELVGGMADLIASTSGPKITLQVDVPASLPRARADANQLEMAILNLAVNARDAMAEDGTLTIAAAQEEVRDQQGIGLGAGSYIRLSVSDTGIGMDEATLAKAIEPFFSTKGVGKGTGLGLSMVHGLASQLGGAMKIASKPGLGTTVSLYLPIDSAERDTRRAPKQAEVAPGAGTVLLVDDEELVRNSTAEMLRELGYRVSEAASAQEALVKLRQQAPDYLVTDHLMPGMSGTDLAQLVASEFPATRTLIVSGYADLEGISPTIPRLAKPFRQVQLRAALQALEVR